MKKILLILIPFHAVVSFAQIAEIGKPLPKWEKGYLDLHHINTGRGNAAFFVFPDGTTMLTDAGENSVDDPRTLSKRNTVIRPNASKQPYQWIAGYIAQTAPLKEKTALDYALITHFHGDHYGNWHKAAPGSKSKKYVLTGVCGVGSLLPIHTLLTRDYNYPVSMSAVFKNYKQESGVVKTWENYLAFVKEQKEHGLAEQFLKAGSKTQIHLTKDRQAFPEFFVQNVKSNGEIWTGKDSLVFQHFPPIDIDNKETWPDENSLSNVVLIRYGAFSYYTGGDCPGNVFLGDPPWRDVETPVAKAVGETDVATMDHHGNRDAVNEFQVKTLKPRVWIEQVWTADHPGHEVLIRIASPHLYKEPRDIFATNMTEANELVIGPMIDEWYKSKQGHILVRVMPGGKNYYVIILDDAKENLTVKNVFGPYISKTPSR